MGDDNTRRGNGGVDDTNGPGGDDRIVLAATPANVDGGGDTDVLIVTSGASVNLVGNTFLGGEATYVRDDALLDMSDVGIGAKIISQCTVSHGVEICGTSGIDRILAGKGADTIDGGAGGDKLFAHSGSYTLHFEAGFGRDKVYGFDLDTDRISVDIAGVEAGDVRLSQFGGGSGTLPTFAGVASGNKIILQGVDIADGRAAQTELFIFGA